MMERTKACAVEGCDRPVLARGWCSMHYQRVRAGLPLGNAAPMVDPHRGCAVEACDGRHFTRGWCSFHYARWRRYGDPLREPVKAQRVCEVAGCEKPHYCQGCCIQHYYYLRRYGVAEEPTRPNMAERFWAKVDKSGNCWLFTGSISTSGYGRFYPSGNQGVQAHRFAYEALVGPIPEGLELDHLCRVRACVNPAHLEPVTPLENLRRAAEFNRKDCCPAGHPYTPENVWLCKPKRPDGPSRRRCKTCRVAYDERRRNATSDALKRGMRR